MVQKKTIYRMQFPVLGDPLPIYESDFLRTSLLFSRGLWPEKGKRNWVWELEKAGPGKRPDT